MKFSTTALAGAAIGLLCNSALAAPVDLSSWTNDNLTGGSSNWTVQNPPANDSVFQSVNGQPTVFFEAGDQAQGRALSGNITVSGGDDDYIGFVLGYDSGDLNSSVTDFLLVDWKARNQGFCGGTGRQGISISRVTSTSGGECDFWTHIGGVEELARGANLGDTGWARNQTYDFELTFTESLVEVFVDSILEISLTAAQAGVTGFNNGAFGFYNYSQAGVTYGAITEDVLPDPCLTNPPGQGGCPSGPVVMPPPVTQPPVGVPEPGVLGLILLGFGSLLTRRRMVAS